MINYKGFRLGNYYYGASRGNIEIVKWETLRDLQEGKLNIQPIPLTEEMHNKFGVYKNGFNSFEYELPVKNNFSIKIIFSDDYVLLRQSNTHNIHEDDVVSVWNKDLTKRDMYLHEFQNLYWCLCGEELTFKN